MSNKIVQSGFWKDLPRPFFILAPMDDVCDAAFRRIVARCAKPDVLMTEFVSVAGLCSEGREHLLHDLWFDPIERPIVAQFFGKEPEKFFECAKLARELRFDGIDINMGCPVKNVIKLGEGAALIQQPELAREIIEATMNGAGPLPVSIKTRIGYDKIIIEEWVSNLLVSKPAAIILHLRTAREMSKVEAHWETVHLAVKVAADSGTLIVGNGDVTSVEHGVRLAEKTGVDGVMLGRAIFGYPWLFDKIKRPESVSLQEKFDIMISHAELFEELYTGRKRFAVMLKHILAYTNGFRGAKELRASLQRVNSTREVSDILDKFKSANSDLLS